MEVALRLAKEAAQEGEVPVGAVVVKEDQIISTGRNRREEGKKRLISCGAGSNPESLHSIGGWRLWQCELFVTLETLSHVYRGYH